MTVFISSTEGKHVLEMSTVLDMIVCNTWFKKIDMKVIPSEEAVYQHHTDVKIKPHKARKQPFIPQRVWVLNERDVKENFVTNDFENVPQTVNFEILKTLWKTYGNQSRVIC